MAAPPFSGSTLASASNEPGTVVWDRFYAVPSPMPSPANTVVHARELPPFEPGQWASLSWPASMAAGSLLAVALVPWPCAPSGAKRVYQEIKQKENCCQLQKFISIQILLRKIQMKYPHAQQNKPYAMVSFATPTKILCCGAK